MTATLNHNDLIKLVSWANSYAKVGTLNGYCPDFADKARERGEDEAWTVYAGSSLSSDKSYYDRERAKFKAAVVIAHGDTVEIEGKFYTVHVNRGNDGAFPRNSDPVRFIAAK